MIDPILSGTHKCTLLARFFRCSTVFPNLDRPSEPGMENERCHNCNVAVKSQSTRYDVNGTAAARITIVR
jgi:hypothetical protein